MNDNKPIELTGEDEDWFACDEAGRVALLFSNSCPLPDSASRANASEALERYMAALPEFTQAALDPVFEAEARLDQSWRDEYKEAFFADILQRGRCGLHVYMFDEGPSAYQRLVIPKDPLFLWALSKEIKSLIAPTRIAKSFTEEQMLPW